MQTEITVTQREQYGATVYHPACPTSETFARIAKTKTLTPDSLKQIASLGYSINVTYPMPTPAIRSVWPANTSRP